jgi:hypothetical protein
MVDEDATIICGVGAPELALTIVFASMFRIRDSRLFAPVPVITEDVTVFAIAVVPGPHIVPADHMKADATVTVPAPERWPVIRFSDPTLA